MAHDPTAVNMKTMSNEAIYRQTWSAFVDEAIAKQQSSNTEGSVEQRIELRDLMRLEEVLSRIESAELAAAAMEKEGRALDKELPGGTENGRPFFARKTRGGTQAKEKCRKPLGEISGPSHLLRNSSSPSPKSPFPSSVPAGNDGAESPNVPSLCGENMEQRGEQLSRRSGHVSERSTAVAVAKPEVVPPEERLGGGVFDARVALFSARELAASVRLVAGAIRKGEDRDRGCSNTAVNEHGVLGNADIQTWVAKEDQHYVAPAASRKISSPKPSPVKLDPLSLEPSTSVGHEVTGRCRRLHLVHSTGSSNSELPPELSCSKVMTPSEEREIFTQLQGEQGAGAGLSKEESRELCALSGSPSLPGRLDVTHIDAAVDVGSDEEVPSTPVSEYEGMLAVTVLEASRCSTDGDCSYGNVDHAGKERGLVGIIEQCESPSLSADRGHRDAITDSNPVDVAHSQSSRVRAQPERLSVEHEQSLSGIGLVPGRAVGGNIQENSGLQMAQLDSDTNAQDAPVIPAPLQSENFDGGFESPRQRSAEATEDGVDESDSRVDSSESPEVVRRSSLRSRELGVGRGSWEAGGGDQGQLRAGGIRDGNDRLSLSQNSIECTEDIMFGSALSPAIDGFGMDVGDVPSPLALAEPHFAEGGSFEGDGFSSPHDAAWSSPARSTRSASRVESQGATPVRDREPPGVEDESLDQSTQTPGKLAESPCGVGTEESEAKGLMPPPPPQLPLGCTRDDRQLQRQQGFPRQAATPGRSQVVENRSWTQHSNKTSAERFGSVAGGAELRLRDESFRDSPTANGGGSERYYEQASIGSFSESEIDNSRLSNASEGKRVEAEVEADISLVEATPRKRVIRSGVDLAGFYAPLLVANITGASKDNSLTTVQWSTLQWMAWRESGEAEGSECEERSPEISTLAGVFRGGILGHLSSPDASTCVLALIQKEIEDAAERRIERAGRLHPATGLPHGATLLVAPTKDAAEDWSNRLGSGAGLSVLSYVMPLKERRRLSAIQVAAFDVVVTTYDILKAKEMPRVMTEATATTPRNCALAAGKWHTRITPQRKKKVAAKTDHMVSLLHTVWWHRVVADGAQILANQRSARAVAVLGLVGRARWCVVERESMATVEYSSDRMRSLTAFLGVPVDVSLVEAAECLFYHSRPSHVAALPPRGSAADTSSTEDEESQCSELRQSGRLPGGVGNAGGSVKGAAGRNRAGRGVGCEAPRQTGGEVDEVLTREHVTYTATALSFRRAQDLEPSEMRRRRGRR